ncbi:hypothetical protein HBI38_107060 [Parastagonospora nodorum]|nr:hypothetical protein HBH52_052150 [Parastagonospora nodorum]KAH4194813.1 hypothetical protein HBH42_085220 [Parastagonospora nodorum]KAH4989836.1 hypothetical protein HBI76_065190 [Parastagonospora nodorum]KAH5277705.1 hypothetical protein HBI72_032800 [Parastagonospora nodorum]KAH5364462.1 hypothetical protein HBI48_076180 [Parastagonospora nodorum]
MPYPLSIPGRASDMSRSPRSPSLWPAVSGIPIYLEAHDERAAAKSYGTTPTTPTTPEILPSSKSSYLSPGYSNAPKTTQTSPEDPSPTTTIQTSSDRSIIWPIPEPPPEVIRQPQTRRPLLRFFPADRPRVRLDGLAINTTLANKAPEVGDYKKGDEPDLGLGIQNGPPKPPSIRIQPPFENEKAEPVANIAQRIEEKIWRYNSSGNIIERWLLEIVSWLISAICMAAIIAVLVVLRDQPASRWPFARMGLTLNAFVSVLSRIAGAALLLPVAEALGQLKWSWFIKGDSKKMWDFEMFDNASRGPWGALLLLIHTKGKTIAALGALVTLFALALDPFFQQLVSFPERWTLQETSSSIARTVRYEPRYPVEYRNGVEMAGDDVDLLAIADPYFVGNGTQPMAFGNATRAEIPLTCPSSNCTWPSYETLGMCSQCETITDLLDFTCIHTRVDWTSTLNRTVSLYPNATVCGYFLNATSAAPVLMSGYIMNDDGKTAGEALLMRTLPLITNYERYPLYGDGSVKFKHVRNPIENVLISSIADGFDVYANKTPILQECVLTWCVKTIQSSYYLGTYKEEVVQTFRNESQGAFPWSTYDIPEENVTYTDYLENVTIAAPPTGNNFSAWGWGVNNDTMLNTVIIFDRLFPAFTSVANASSEPVFRWRTGSPDEVRTKYLDFNPWLLPNNITHHFERLAQAVTNVIRSSVSNEYISGQAFDNEVYVEVRWAWLSLPVGLLLISCVFLLATVIKSATEKDQVSIRKNSAIATLLYGLPDHFQKGLAKSNSKGTPRARAKELKVRLSATRGWRASGDVFSPMTPKMPKNLPPPGWI